MGEGLRQTDASQWADAVRAIHAQGMADFLEHFPSPVPDDIIIDNTRDGVRELNAHGLDICVPDRRMTLQGMTAAAYVLALVEPEQS